MLVHCSLDVDMFLHTLKRSGTVCCAWLMCIQETFFFFFNFALECKSSECLLFLFTSSSLQIFTILCENQHDFSLLLWSVVIISFPFERITRCLLVPSKFSTFCLKIDIDGFFPLLLWSVVILSFWEDHKISYTNTHTHTHTHAHTCECYPCRATCLLNRQATWEATQRCTTILPYTPYRPSSALWLQPSWRRQEYHRPSPPTVCPGLAVNGQNLTMEPSLRRWWWAWHLLS